MANVGIQDGDAPTLRNGSQTIFHSVDCAVADPFDEDNAMILLMFPNGVQLLGPSSEMIGNVNMIVERSFYTNGPHNDFARQPLLSNCFTVRITVLPTRGRFLSVTLSCLMILPDR
jgi:hypothetical protein